jgi:hypothetical protein
MARLNESTAASASRQWRTKSRAECQRLDWSQIASQNAPELRLIRSSRVWPGVCLAPRDGLAMVKLRVPFRPPLGPRVLGHEATAEGDNPAVQSHGYRFAGDGLPTRAGLGSVRRYRVTASARAISPAFVST